MRMLLIFIPQSVSPQWREKRGNQNDINRAIVPPVVLCGVTWYIMVWCGMTWYFKVWRGMMCSIVPPNNHTSRLINHKSCHLGQLIHRILNPCDDQFDFNCLLFSKEEEEPDHYCHRVSSFSKLHILKKYKSISCVVCFSLGLIDAASSIKAQ